jgi:hypothetical protein
MKLLVIHIVKHEQPETLAWNPAIRSF